jgi:hypothetical protein
MDYQAKSYFGVGVAADVPFFREIGDFLLSLIEWFRFPIKIKKVLWDVSIHYSA